MSKMILSACLLAASVIAHAQSVAPPAPPLSPAPPLPPTAPQPPVFPFGAGDDLMMFVSSELGGRSVIKGAPYAATAINETRQVLNDGNRIERTSSSRLYRDSHGRTRQEQAGGAVFINDVVAGKAYVLNPQRQSARELRIPHRMQAPPVPPVPPVSAVPPIGVSPPPQPTKPHAQMSPEEARSWGDDMRRWAREFTERMRGEQQSAREGHNVVISRSITQSDTTEGLDMRTDHVEVIRMDDGRAVLPSMPSTAMLPPPGPGTTTLLGSREFEGVRAEGKKTTWTIPAGRIGNKLPIEIVSERWHAPDLNLVVFTRHADPRTGERIYRLENIKREEPSAELFKVPPEYAMKSAPAARAERR